MKVFCQYSGVEFDVTGFGGTQLVGVHPIFYAEPKFLLSRMGSWAAQKLNEEESRLLFLAILHSTELVEFRATAHPENNIVQLNMEPLARIYSWMLGLSRAQLVLPKFIVQQDNRRLLNVKHWIENWYGARKDYEDGYSKYLTGKALQTKEEALERLIRNAQKTTEDYAGLLCTWALQASSAPKGLGEYWRELFTLKGLKVYAARTVDLQELVDHMEEHLEHGSIFAASTMKHLRTLLKKNQAGLNYGLGITDEDLEEISSSPFKIVEGSIEEHNMAVVAAQAPEIQPDPKNFTSRVQYLRVKAAWDLAQKAKQYAQEFTQHVEDSVAEDEELNELLEDAEGGADDREVDVEFSTTTKEEDHE
jgi:hypothetical protein